MEHLFFFIFCFFFPFSIQTDVDFSSHHLFGPPLVKVTKVTKLSGCVVHRRSRSWSRRRIEKWLKLPLNEQRVDKQEQESDHHGWFMKRSIFRSRSGCCCYCWPETLAVELLCWHWRSHCDVPNGNSSSSSSSFRRRSMTAQAQEHPYASARHWSTAKKMCGTVGNRTRPAILSNNRQLYWSTCHIQKHSMAHRMAGGKIVPKFSFLWLFFYSFYTEILSLSLPSFHLQFVYINFFKDSRQIHCYWFRVV